MSMKPLAMVAAALMAAGAMPALAAPADTTPQSRDCLDNRDIRGTRLWAGNGYFAETRAGWWRNTGAACPAFAEDRSVQTVSNSNRQCRGDLVQVFDPFSRIQYGGCTLGRWERVAEAPPRTDK